MELNYGKFQRVIDDLEGRGATVHVLAYVNTKARPWADERLVEYTSEASFPSGRAWEIVRIHE